MDTSFQRVILLFIFLNTSWVVFGQAPKYSNEFLSIGVSARAHGMANSVVGHVDDVTAAYWNPAGLTDIKSPLQVSIMHAEWFAGIAAYDHIGIAKKLNANPNKESTFAFSLVRLGIDNIPNTFYLVSPDGTVNYDNVTSFSAADYGLFFSYAQKIPYTNFSVGGSTKIIRRVIGSFGTAWGFGIDLGTQLKRGDWRFGLLARDISFTFNAWSFGLTDDEKIVFLSTGNEIPTSTLEVTTPRFILGAAYVKKINNRFQLIAEMDLDLTTDGERNVLISTNFIEVDPHVGLELGYQDLIFLRAGLNNVQQATDIDGTEFWTVQPNLGIGMRLGKFSLDYAFTDIGNVSQVLYSHIFSMKVDFKSKDAEKLDNLKDDAGRFRN